MSGLNLPDDLTGWSVSLASTPDAVLRVSLHGSDNVWDVSPGVHHFTFVHYDTKTVEVNVLRFTDATAKHIQEILEAWDTAPRGVASQIADAMAKIDPSKLMDALKFLEYIIRLVIEHGGPVLSILQALG